MLYKKNLLLAGAFLLFFSSCKKNTDEDNGPKSNWDFDGISYKERTVPTRFSAGSLYASDNTLNGDVSILFGSRPTSNGSFRGASQSDTSVLRPGTDCIITLNTASRTYKSTGKSGNTVVVNVGTNGKLTATFTDFEMANPASPGNKRNVSGTLIEK